MGDFDACFNFTLGEEGGFSNLKYDSGGATKYGVTLATLSAHRGYQCTVEDVEGMELGEAKDIYRKNYWLPIAGDKLPQCLALCTFDAAINSGVKQSVQWLQSAVGVKPDGVVGPLTIKATQAHDSADTANELLNMRLSFLKELPEWKYFGKGWSNRLAALRCEAI